MDFLEMLLRSWSNGDWEHGPAISIESIDNPGWKIDICVTGTPSANIDFPVVDIERSESDWIYIKIDNRGHDKFVSVACGPSNLQESLKKLSSILLLENPRAE